MKILIAIVAILAIFAAVVAMQPAEFRVTRTATISPSAVSRQALSRRRPS